MTLYIAPKPLVAKKKTVEPLANPAAIPINSPLTQPLVAQQVTDPFAPANISIAPQQPAVDPLASSNTPTAPLSQPGLFATTPEIGSAYNNVLQNSLTGKIYDPFAAGTKEAMARAEANKRAGVANQIAGAGFTGQGIGQQIAAGAEGDILKNRFATLNGIEQARVTAQQGALGEARAYGQANEGIRQFDVGQSNWQKNFDQEKTRYKDSQAWTAYEQALATGSDADVIARYKEATGKDLDPMAVSQYRGYYRSSQEQGLAAGNVAIKTAQTTLDTMKRTDAGTALSSYLTTHLDANASDPAMTPMLQKYWESLGNTGTVPKDWADQQVKAARDVRLNTENGAFNYQVDQQVKSGIYTQEQGDLLKTFNSSQLTQFLVKDPTTGVVKFDTAAYLASLSGGTGTGTGAGAIIDPTTGTQRVEGSVYVGEGGNIYRVTDGNPEKLNMEDIDYPTITYNKVNGTDVGTLNSNVGDFVKLKTPTGLQPLQMVNKIRTSDNQYTYVFKDTNGVEMRLVITGPGEGYWQTQKTTGAKYNLDGTLDRSGETVTWVNGQKMQIK